MQFTPRETAHILAALRTCQLRGINKDWHFDGTEPLSDSDVDLLCERLNVSEPDEATDAPDARLATNSESNPDHAFTVVGLYPDSEWDSSMHDSSFVEHVSAKTPIEAAKKARTQMAKNRLSSPGSLEDATMKAEVVEFAENIEILAVFNGFLNDEYDPQGLV